MSIEAIKQALDALEMYLALETHDEAHILEVDIAPKTITALRAAIEQAEKQEPVAQIIALGQYEFPGLEWLSADHSFRAPIGTLLYTTPPAAQRQEQYDQTSLELCEECGWKALIPGEGCLTCARQKAKPVAWMDEFGNVFPLGAQRGPKYLNEPMKPLYTTPPVAPRQWVELTDEEVNDCIKLPNRNLFARDGTTSQRIARAIEAKLKEKNI